MNQEMWKKKTSFGGIPNRRGDLGLTDLHHNQCRHSDASGIMTWPWLPSYCWITARIPKIGQVDRKAAETEGILADHGPCAWPWDLQGAMSHSPHPTPHTQHGQCSDLNGEVATGSGLLHIRETYGWLTKPSGLVIVVNTSK